jgi:hypothetical protein
MMLRNIDAAMQPDDATLLFYYNISWTSVILLLAQPDDETWCRSLLSLIFWIGMINIWFYKLYV